MDDKNPYEQMIEKLYAALERKDQTIISLVLMFDKFVESILSVVKNLNEINEKSNSGLKNKDKTQMTESTNQWLSEYVSSTKGLTKFSNQIKTLIILALNNFRSYVNVQCNIIKTKISQATKLLQSEEEKYSNVYSKYLALCDQIEKEMDYQKCELLKTKCSVCEKECVDMCGSLGLARKTYCRDVEETFVIYENIENEYYELINRISAAFIAETGELRDFYSLLGDEGMRVLDTLIKIGGEDPKNETRQRRSQSVNVSSNGTDLQFNIFKYIDCKTVYKNVLKGKTYRVVKDYNEEMPIGIYVKTGDFVEIIKKNGRLYNIESLETGLRGDVPKEYVEDAKFSRRICKLECDFEVNSVRYEKGIFLCAVSEGNGFVKCKTPSLNYLSVPKELLVNV